jgi:hypothetical protein
MTGQYNLIITKVVHHVLICHMYIGNIKNLRLFIIG